MTKLRAFLASVVLALLTVLAVAQPAAADDNAPITRYDATVNLTDDGVAEITVDFTMDFSQVRGRGPIIILPLRQEDGADPDWDYVFDYSNIRVDSPSGASAQVSTQYEGRLMSLRIGDENRWNTTPQDYTLSYSVTGFIVSDHSQSGMDEFNWDIIGPGWASRISNVTATVTGPAAVSQVACFYGPYTAQQPCEASSSGDTATFSHAETLPPKNPVQIVAGFPAGTFGGVEQRREKAQTLANVYMALENDLEIIPVINKIDLPSAEPERVKEEIRRGRSTGASIAEGFKKGISTIVDAKSPFTAEHSQGVARLALDLALPGSGKAGTNPEQLFALGYAACFDNAAPRWPNR